MPLKKWHGFSKKHNSRHGAIAFCKTPALLALLLAAMLCFTACTKTQKPDPQNLGSTSNISEAKPTPKPTEPPAAEDAGQNDNLNPLTGFARPEDMEKGARSVAVMVANDARAYPQRGLAAADILVEMPLENGATRLMAMYSDYRALPLVGPIRSIQDQFVQLAAPYNAIMVYIDATTYSRNLLEVMGMRAIDGVTTGTTAFWFDVDRSLPKPGGKLNESCWFTDAGLLWGGMELLDIWTHGEFPNIFRFSAEGHNPRDNALIVKTNYSESVQVDFIYNADTRLYDKTAFGTWHTDEDGGQLSYKNLVLLSCDIEPKPDSTYIDVKFQNGGTGVYITDGAVTPITWAKPHPTAPLQIFNTETGAEVAVQPGKSYIGVYPATQPNAFRYMTSEESDPLNNAEGEEEGGGEE